MSPFVCYAGITESGGHRPQCQSRQSHRTANKDTLSQHTPLTLLPILLLTPQERATVGRTSGSWSCSLMVVLDQCIIVLLRKLCLSNIISVVTAHP